MDTGLRRYDGVFAGPIRRWTSYHYPVTACHPFASEGDFFVGCGSSPLLEGWHAVTGWLESSGLWCRGVVFSDHLPPAGYSSDGGELCSVLLVPGGEKQKSPPIGGLLSFCVIYANILATSSAKLSSRFSMPSPNTKNAKPANLPLASAMTSLTVLDGSITNGCSSRTLSP